MVQTIHLIVYGITLYITLLFFYKVICRYVLLVWKWQLSNKYVPVKFARNLPVLHVPWPLWIKKNEIVHSKSGIEFPIVCKENLKFSNFVTGDKIKSLEARYKKKHTFRLQGLLPLHGRMQDLHVLYVIWR